MKKWIGVVQMSDGSETVTGEVVGTVDTSRYNDWEQLGVWFKEKRLGDVSFPSNSCHTSEEGVYRLVRVDESEVGFTKTDLEGIDDPTFDQCSAACEECTVNIRNAEQIMKGVMVGDIEPEKFWCEEHVSQFQQRMKEYREGKDRDGK